MAIYQEDEYKEVIRRVKQKIAELKIEIGATLSEEEISRFEVSDFCEAVGVSKSLLNKKLQNLIGQSAGQFIRNYRLNIARELILKNRETKNMNIAEVAYEVGFNDPKYFTRCFTKHFNVTPSALLNNEE